MDDAVNLLLKVYFLSKYNPSNGANTPPLIRVEVRRLESWPLFDLSSLPLKPRLGVCYKPDVQLYLSLSYDIAAGIYLNLIEIADFRSQRKQSSPRASLPHRHALMQEWSFFKHMIHHPYKALNHLAFMTSTLCLIYIVVDKLELTFLKLLDFKDGAPHCLKFLQL